MLKLKSFSFGFMLLCGMSLVLSILATNSYLTILSIIILILIILLVWRPNEPPVLPMVLALQWLQSSMVIFQANFYGIAVNDYYPNQNTDTAAVLSMVGVLAVALGVRLTIGKTRLRNSAEIRLMLADYSIKKIFYFYLVSMIVLFALKIVSRSVPALTQAVLGLNNIQWAIFFILACVAFSKRKGLLFLGLALLFELGTSFFTGWSSWKEPLFIVGLAYLTISPKISFTKLVKISPLFVLLLYLSVAWSLQKTEIRTMRGSQTIAQQTSGVIRMLDYENVTEYFSDGMVMLTDRISYVDYFARVMRVVPDLLPHENGTLWWRAVTHVLQPRLLFPGKEALISDSMTTSFYTRDRVSGDGGEATSIGVGYFAESYIDFGPYFMFIPILILGMVAGYVYRYFLKREGDRIIGMAFNTTIFISVFKAIETSNVKIVGALISSFIVLALAKRYGSVYFIRYTRDRTRLN